MIKTNQVKPFTYGLNKSVVSGLNKLPVRDFITNSTDVIQNAMGIPKTIGPNLLFRKTLPKNTPIGYAFYTNDILITESVFSNNRPVIFSQLVHELTHCFQNMQILRTKKLGNEAITTYSLLNAGRNTHRDFNYLEGLSPKALKKEEQASPPEVILSLIKAIKSKKPGKISDAYHKLFDQIYEESTSFLNTIRSVLIAEKGAIDDASERGITAKKYFKSFLSANVLGEDFTRERYVNALTEQIAHCEQENALKQYIRINNSIRKAPATCPKFPADQSLL